MNKASPYILTISRQIGSGGAYLGQRLAIRLNASYLDHDIVRQAAQELKIRKNICTAAMRKSLPAGTRCCNQLLIQIPGRMRRPRWISSMTRISINAKSDIINRVASQRAAIIVGRGGYWVLRHHHRVLSVFLHAPISFRQKRVEELYHVTQSQALKLINSIDQERARYLKALTGADGSDASLYHLCLDTSAIGLEKCEAIILEALQARFW